jgi:ribosomal protein L37E
MAIIFDSPPPLTSTPMDEQTRTLIRSTWLRGTWHNQSDFICRKCGGPAYAQPEGPRQWGCPDCGFVTYSVSLYFKPKSEAVAA